MLLLRKRRKNRGKEWEANEERRRLEIEAEMRSRREQERRVREEQTQRFRIAGEAERERKRKADAAARTKREERERKERERQERERQERERLAKLNQDTDEKDNRGMWTKCSDYVKNKKWTWAAGALSVLGEGCLALFGGKSDDTLGNEPSAAQEGSDNSLSNYKTIGAAAGVIVAAAVGAWCARDKISSCLGKANSESSDVSEDHSQHRKSSKKRQRSTHQRKGWLEKHRIHLIIVVGVIGLLALSFCLLCGHEKTPEPPELEGEDLL